MQQRGRSGQPGKRRRANRPKARKISTAAPSVATLQKQLDSDLQKQLDALSLELKEAREQQAATAEVLQTINSSRGDLAAVFDGILLRAIRLCEAAFGNLWLYDGKSFDLVAAQGPFPPNYLEMLSQAGQDAGPNTAMRRAVLTQRTIHIADYQLEQAYLERDPVAVATAEVGKARTILAVPMVGEARALGVFFVYRQQVRSFSERHIALLQNFADQAVIAIENARLFNETREALERQTATADILKVIASSPDDVQPVFQAIADRSNQLVNALSTTVFRLVDGIMHLQAFTSVNQEADASLKAIFPAPLSTFSWNESIRRGEIYSIIDAEQEPKSLRDVARLRGWRSCLCVPLLRDGKLIGMIGPTRAAPGPFPDNHVQLLQTFADQAVIAISNVGLFHELKERTRQLSQSLDDLRTAQDRLVQTEKLASLGQLTAGIAHEIKNPLNFINNFSSLSAELVNELRGILAPAPLDQKLRGDVDELTQMLKSNLEKVVQHGKRADSIVKNMLLHSREGSGEHRAVHINALVEESLNLAYHGARAEKAGFSITLRHDLDPEAGALELYPQEITRALLNLISNGFYAAARRKVEVGNETFEPVLSATTRNFGKTVEIRIRDNGTGIPPEVREKMFNPFFTTKPTGEGTGLGLSMTHDIIVKQHGGRIDVETEPGAFTEFIITLPRDNGTAARQKPE